MPRTDGIGSKGKSAAPSINKKRGNGKYPVSTKRPAQPAKGNNGHKGVSTSTHVGHLLLPMKTGRKFTPMEARFITEFLKDPAAPPRDIAIRAGYSSTSAAQQAAQILRKPHILAEIEDQMHAFVQRERLSIQRLVRHLIELAEVDKREFYNTDGSLKSPGEWTKNMAALVKGVTISEIWDSPGARDKVQVGELKKVQFTDHLEPVRMLAKSLQGVVDRVQVQSQSMNYHKHEVEGVGGVIGDIDFTLLTEEELLLLKGVYEKVRERSRAIAMSSASGGKGE